jgi:hypothetical protein
MRFRLANQQYGLPEYAQMMVVESHGYSRYKKERVIRNLDKMKITEVYLLASLSSEP